ncbi:MAG: hypothetical protein V4645_27840 [Pseudomonadota bacterium]
MIEIIGGVWAANETKTFMINGEYLEILEAQYPCDVMLMDKAGAQLSIMRGSEASFFSRPKEGFQAVQITSVQPQAIRVFVGTGDAGTRRISSTVSVIDGGRARVNAGVAYAAGIDVTAVATKQSCVQLWNPAGSGKRLVLGQLAVISSAASSVACYPSNTSLAFVAVPPVVNKLLGGAVGVAQARIDQLAVPPTYTFGVAQTLGAQLAASAFWKPTEPMVIPPGFGMNVVLSAANVNLSAGFEWFEETI